MSNSLARYFEDHFLPHREHGRRAKLINYSALSTYILFVASIILTLNILTIRLPGILGFASNIAIGDIVAGTNRMREANGLSSLRVDVALSEAARRKAEDMFSKDYWAHNAPDGTEPWYFITSSGYSYLYAGENLARDFQVSQAVVDAWVASPSHRENLLNPRYQDIGVAVVNGSLGGFETTLVVQMFGSKSRLAAIPPAAAAPTAPVETEVSPPAPVVEIEPVPEVPLLLEEAPALEIPAPSKAPVSKPLPAPRKFEIEPTFLTAAQEVTLPAFDIFAFSRTLSLILGGFTLFLFAMDGFIMLRYHNRRLTGHTIAHVSLLIVAILGIWYVNVGVIL